MNEAVLVESPSARNEYVQHVDVLDKVKKLSLLPDDVHVTVQMAATYYESPQRTVETLIRSHKEELQQDGLKVLSGEELKRFATWMTKVAKDDTLISSKTRHLMVLPRRAVLRIGMLLRDSEVAKRVRDHLLDAEQVTQLGLQKPTLTEKVDVLRWIATNAEHLLSVLPADSPRLPVIQSLYQFAGIPLPVSVEAKKPVGNTALTLVEPNPVNWHSCKSIATRLGVYTVHQNPHVQLIGAILRTFGELIPDVDWKPVRLTQGAGQPDILASKYSGKVASRIAQVFKQYDWPDSLRVLGRTYQIQYRNLGERGKFAILQ
ncbi:hypothetical protein LLE49_25145 [Alicyclobacillus tolerans]|uniref:hypothetical protein n=1 Tax=Alicyclobacillus tolerans TaxID=90970 RepID=UPI001F189CED|nr:hypothetical protein [Alicyclobacillus tolerans]MCF8568015.1 hypothetical protein [Alicyclobacillus tolerans]